MYYLPFWLRISIMAAYYLSLTLMMAAFLGMKELVSECYTAKSIALKSKILFKNGIIDKYRDNYQY